ncbi:hypothetical protein CYMTET_27295 [Cymbomonas tetramitiformis]|uniref:Uncharacterized protein n=1 Tax=Cymbomonas tetramitiformis TaxID=36881 RepID=A0AAE0FRL5_9CHLO|nr:hypothetical protein CYMTET_27295 [Cymbomonas tetramitiformis]
MESSAETRPFDGKRVLLEIARMLLDSGGPFQGTADLLAIKITQSDPSRTIAAFNAALRSARRKSTLDDMEVKSLYIKSLDPVFYAPVVNRLLLHDQRAAESLATIQQWTRECYAQNGTDSHVPPAARTFSALTLTGQSDDEDFKTIFSELRDQLFDMKKEIKALHNRVDDTKGFTTRNDKKNAIERGGHGDGVRFAAKPLPEHGNFPQTFRGKPSGKVAFHKPTALRTARTTSSPRCSRTPSMDNNDAARFDAVCYIADGKPELYDTVSAFSFAVAEEQVPDTIDEYLECCQPADIRFGRVARAPEPHMSFMDKFTVNLGLTGPEPTLAMHSMGTVAPVDSVSVAADGSRIDDGGLPPAPRQALGCGRPPMGFGFSALTSLAVCVLFVVCATAMPSQGHSAQASSATPEHTGDEVGGAAARSGSDRYRAALAGWCSTVADLCATRLGRVGQGCTFFVNRAQDPAGCARCN